MKDVSWINHPTMKNIDVRKLAVLVDLINEAEGKPLDKSLPILLKANTKLKAMNLSFTPSETDLVLEILTNDMSPTEKQKFQTMKTMMINTINANKR